MQIRYKKIETPFSHAFTISKATKTHQPSLVVELDHFGIKGYGEAPAISYYHITVEKMIEDIERKRIFLEKFSFTDPERYWHYLHHLFPQNNFLVCALDMAGWDIFGKWKRAPLYKLWNLPTPMPTTDYTVGIAEVETMVAKMKEKPMPIYKVKMGFDDDIATIAALRKETNAVFRVDANGGWTLEQALEKIPQLQKLGVELVEQPLAKDAWDEMKILFQESPLPLFADESCVVEADVAKCINHFHGINIKLTKCSGITPARRMIADARSKGLKVMLGCMNETTVGTAAMVHLSPLVDYLDADGPLLLDDDVASGIKYALDGKISLQPNNGLGIDVDLKKLFDA